MLTCYQLTTVTSQKTSCKNYCQERVCWHRTAIKRRIYSSNILKHTGKLVKNIFYSL